MLLRINFKWHQKFLWNNQKRAFSSLNYLSTFNNTADHIPNEKHISSSVYSWGNGDDGQLGHDTIEKSGFTLSYAELSPRRVLALDGQVCFCNFQQRRNDLSLMRAFFCNQTERMWCI